MFYAVEETPIHSNVLLPSRDAALSYPRGSLELASCARCGLIHNARYDRAHGEYGADYEETQGYSPTFRRWLQELVSSLTRRYPLRGGRVLEIGCGKGEFLILLTEGAGARGLGFDPTLDVSRVDPTAGVDLLPRRYGREDGGLEVDLVCCRHTLEHIPDVAAFVRMLRENLGASRVPVFFEVPDTLRILEEGAFWDLYYEHCSYFTPGSIARLFRSSDFDVEGLELAYGAQYVRLFARAGGPRAAPHLPLEDDLERIDRAIERFRERVRASLERWHAFLARARSEGETVVLWGSGSKAVGFLATLGGESGVRHVVDINPHKHGRFVAGTGQEIVPPEFLRIHPPAHVVVMNPVYRDEIAVDLARMGLAPAIHMV